MMLHRKASGKCQLSLLDPFNAYHLMPEVKKWDWTQFNLVTTNYSLLSQKTRPHNNKNILGNQNKSPKQPLIDFCFWEKFRVRFRGCTRPRCSERSEARTRWRRPSPCTCRCASSSEGCTSSCCRCEPTFGRNQDSCVGLSHRDRSIHIEWACVHSQCNACTRKSV